MRGHPLRPHSFLCFSFPTRAPRLVSVLDASPPASSPSPSPLTSRPLSLSLADPVERGGPQRKHHHHHGRPPRPGPAPARPGRGGRPGPHPPRHPDLSRRTRRAPAGGRHRRRRGGRVPGELAGRAGSGRRRRPRVSASEGESPSGERGRGRGGMARPPERVRTQPSMLHVRALVEKGDTVQAGGDAGSERERKKKNGRHACRKKT